MYARTDTYCHERDSDQAAEHFATASREIDHLLEQLRTLDVAYARSLEQMSKRLGSLLHDDFTRNPSALPATISIDHDSKKYPLHIAQRQHHISFIVRNPGPGYAYDVALLVAGDEPLTLTMEPVFIGRLAPHSHYRVDVEGSLTAPATTAAMNVIAAWRNFDGTSHEDIFELTLLGQKVDVPWNRLAELQPYSLEPIETEEDLIGREELFQRLVATITAKNAGSVILHGQKRIGKTVPHPVPWTHICAMPPGTAHTPRAPRSAFDTQASRDARSGCTAPRSRPRRRGRPRGSERFGRGSLAP